MKNLLLLCVLSALLWCPAYAGKDPYKEITGKCLSYPGLFQVWRDKGTGKVYLDIQAAQFDQSYLYFSFFRDAPAETNHFRGDYQACKILQIVKQFGNIEFRQLNTAYYIDPQSPLSKSQTANINQPILAVEKIVAVSSDAGHYLLDGDRLFLNEKLQPFRPLERSDLPPPLTGQINAEKSAWDRINNYPQNTELSIRLVFENDKPHSANSGMADGRYMTVIAQHTLMKMPAGDFQPRFSDPQVGYFVNRSDDLTALQSVADRDVIWRWHLEKKDPAAALSDPVDPIVFWIENTTPVEAIPVVREAVLSWNLAFEKAGFSHAVDCRIQPANAEWDAGDIRYNVIRWLASPSLQFLGFGPAFVNPLTGQILGADILIEFATFQMMDMRSLFLQTGPGSTMGKCLAGADLTGYQLFSEMKGPPDDLADMLDNQMIRAYLSYLVAHEVGHTLGLSHNFHGSTLLSPEQMKNNDILQKMGTSASIMDYISYHVNRGDSLQQVFINTKPGIYDEWAIEYGYSPALSDKEAERKRLQLILDRGMDTRLQYGNDDDIMRGAGMGVDPDIAAYDYSSDPVAYSTAACRWMREQARPILYQFLQKGEDYQTFVNACQLYLQYYSRHLQVFSRYIGGVHYRQWKVGDDAELPALVPVGEATQREAMLALAQYAFHPDAFRSIDSLYDRTLPMRRGFNLHDEQKSEYRDPHIHQRLLQIQSECLDHLLHPVVMARIVDSQRYGNTYAVDQVMLDLTDAIFQSDARTAVNTLRQQLQTAYVRKLIAIAGKGSTHDAISQSNAFAMLQRIDLLEQTAPPLDQSTNAHRNFIRFLIRQLLHPDH